MIEVAFRNILAADNGQNSDGVKSIVADRIYFGIRPQDERRALVVLSLVSDVPGHTLDGPDGTATGRMQVNCLAPTYAQAKILAAAVDLVLDGYTGESDGTIIAYIETENMKDIPAMPLVGAATAATFGVSVDARFLTKN